MSTPSTDADPPSAVDAWQDMLVAPADGQGADPRVRQQAALLAFGRRATAQPPISVLMQDAVALVAEVLDADLCGVVEVSADGTTLSMSAASRGDEELPAVSKVHKLPMDAGVSMAAYALTTAAPAVSVNIAREKRFTDLFLRKLNVVSALTLPLHLGTKPFGALGVYRTELREFTADDVLFAETIGHLLASSISRVKAEEAVRMQQVFSSAVLDTVGALVLVLDADGTILDMNRACREVGGFLLEEVRGRTFWSTYAVPEETQTVFGIFRDARAETFPCQFESFFQTRHGKRHRMAWSQKAIRGADGELRKIVLTGIDKTDQLVAETELRRVKGIARKATEALQNLMARQKQAGIDPGELPEVPGDLGVPDFDDGEDEQLSPFQRIVGKVGKELRSSPRRAFNYRQRIAPIHAGVIPSHKNFFEVVCRDISGGGLAFVLDHPPDYQSLVVALGMPPSVCYFSARVVRISDIVYEGKPAYLVGCQFTGRVHL